MKIIVSSNYRLLQLMEDDNDNDLIMDNCQCLRLLSSAKKIIVVTIKSTNTVYFLFQLDPGLKDMARFLSVHSHLLGNPGSMADIVQLGLSQPTSKYVYGRARQEANKKMDHIYFEWM